MTFPEDVVEQIRSAPGVEAAGYARILPMMYLVSTVTLSTSPPAPNHIPGPPPPPTVSRPREFPDARIVSREYLNAMGIGIIAGRGFTEGDSAGRPQVMLINQTLARSGLFGNDPIEQQIYALGSLPWEIVGIVEDYRQFLDVLPTPQVLFDNRQVPRPAASAAFTQGPLPYFVVRTAKEATSIAASLVRIIRQLDPQATIADVATME